MSATTRAAAARIIAAAVDGISLRESLPAQLANTPAEDRALLQQLCYGSLRSYHRLTPMLHKHLRKPLKSKDADIQALLVCGLYQLLEMRTPDHAALSTTVEACRKLNKQWATGLVNGVLRNCLRQREELETGLSEAQLLSHPDWLYRDILSAWPQQTQSIVSANNRQPPMYLRCNQRQTSREDYLAELAAADIAARATELSSSSVLLEQAVDVTRLPGFEQGRVSVQDESAQLAAILLAPKPGERILDACSAPGGKTCHLLELEPDLAELVACDIDASRLERVEENLERLQLQASVCSADVSSPPAEWTAQSFDRILVDAPCSGSGVIRRHPDIKLLRRDTDIAAMAEQQLEILEGLWPLLKPGGTLLYVTCSILPMENSNLVSRFVKEHEDAIAVELNSAWGEDCPVGRQLLPDPEGPDGLYYAPIQKL